MVPATWRHEALHPHPPAHPMPHTSTRSRVLRSGRARLAALLCAGLGLSTLSGLAHAGPKAWISLDEAALQVLRAATGATAEPTDSVAIPVQLPRADGGLAQAAQQVHLLQVDADLLPRLSQQVHEALHRCGGFIVHRSQAEGRQALARAQALGHSPNGLLKATATVPDYRINDSKRVQRLMRRLDEAQLLAGIQRLADYQNRFYNSSHGVAASNDLATRWLAMAAGRSDVTVEQVDHSWPQKSVVMTIQGKERPDELVVLGGHLDSIAGFGINKNARSPGADDDASGIATVEEVARVLLSSGYQPKRSIQFIAYAAEEVGLRGSNAIATRYQAEGRNVVGALQLDMTNYQGSSTSDIVLITDYTNAAQNDFLANLASTYLPELVVTRSACGYACSDHASWHNAGYAASFPFEAPLGQDNPHIHTQGDTLDKSGNSAAHAFKFSRLALAYAVELGSDASP